MGWGDEVMRWGEVMSGSGSDFFLGNGVVMTQKKWNVENLKKNRNRA